MSICFFSSTQFRPKPGHDKRRNAKMSGRAVATDVRSRTKLQPILGQIASSGPAANGSAEGQSEGYLDALEESLNVRVDGEVELLASGLAELVALTKIERKDHFQVAQDSFQSAIRTESVVSLVQFSTLNPFLVLPNSTVSQFLLYRSVLLRIYSPSRTRSNCSISSKTPRSERRIEKRRVCCSSLRSTPSRLRLLDRLARYVINPFT